MSAQTKARVAGVFLIALMLWPVAHRALVLRLDLDPWRFYGFAMYCTRHAIRVELHDVTGKRPRRIAHEDLHAGARGLLDVWSLRRLTLGRLQSTEPLARAVLATSPGLESLEITVYVLRLRPRGERIEATARLYRYSRSTPD